MGMGPLPWRAMRAWADDRAITRPDAFDDLVSVVQHLDGLLLKHAASKLPKPPKKKG